jgi:hypothetical protein
MPALRFKSASSADNTAGFWARLAMWPAIHLLLGRAGNAIAGEIT